MVREICNGVESLNRVTREPALIRFVVRVGCIKGVVVLNDCVSPEIVLSAPLNGTCGKC